MIKLAAENSEQVLSLILRTVSHTFSFTNITIILKKVLKIQNHIDTTSEKVFIPKHFSNKSTKIKNTYTWLLRHKLTEWIFLHSIVFTNIINNKKQDKQKTQDYSAS